MGLELQAARAHVLLDDGRQHLAAVDAAERALEVGELHERRRRVRRAERDPVLGIPANRAVGAAGCAAAAAGGSSAPERETATTIATSASAATATAASVARFRRRCSAADCVFPLPARGGLLVRSRAHTRTIDRREPSPDPHTLRFTSRLFRNSSTRNPGGPASRRTVQWRCSSSIHRSQRSEEDAQALPVRRDRRQHRADRLRDRLHLHGHRRPRPRPLRPRPRT